MVSNVEGEDEEEEDVKEEVLVSARQMHEHVMTMSDVTDKGAFYNITVNTSS